VNCELYVFACRRRRRHFFSARVFGSFGFFCGGDCFSYILSRLTDVGEGGDNSVSVVHVDGTVVIEGDGDTHLLTEGGGGGESTKNIILWLQTICFINFKIIRIFLCSRANS